MAATSLSFESQGIDCSPRMKKSLHYRSLSSRYKMASASSVKIAVYPSLTTLIDQKIDIIVSGLSSEQNITLRAQTVDDSKIVFESFASYKANSNGEVLMSSQPSLGGSYTGIEPMGLLWSMKPVTKLDRDDLFRKRDVTSPLKVTVDVYSGNDRDEEKGKLEQRTKEASITLVRNYMGDGVTRYFVDDSGFYGTLFLPAGDGPFPGVVDMWGRTGGIREDRAALLASNGFACLVIAYCEYKDLPNRFSALELSYFERAVDWLIAHPKVTPDGVGLIGLSMGGVLVLAIASQIPHKIKAVVSISGHHTVIGFSLKCSNFTIPGHPVGTATNYTPYLNFVSIHKSKEACKPGSPSIVPVEHITCPVLLVYGLADDLNPETEWMCEEVFKHMDKHGKGSLCTRLGLPGTGHFITPCYLPPGTKQYVRALDEVWILGGENTAQAKASELYWHESLEFLFKNINVL